jgi:hypothetical protein
MITRLFVLACVAAAVAQSPGGAQTPTKKVLGVEDYSRWRSINGSAISGDGKWVTYVLAQTNTAPADAKPVLHILRLDNNQDVEVANATAPAFSADSRWVAYQIDPNSGGRGGRGGPLDLQERLLRLRLQHAKILGNWNYTIRPTRTSK